MINANKCLFHLATPQEQHTAFVQSSRKYYVSEDRPYRHDCPTIRRAQEDTFEGVRLVPQKTTKEALWKRIPVLSLSLSFSSVFSSVSGQSYKFNVSTAAAWQTDEAWLNRRGRGGSEAHWSVRFSEPSFSQFNLFFFTFFSHFSAVGESERAHTDHMKYCLPPHSLQTRKVACLHYRREGTGERKMEQSKRKGGRGARDGNRDAL